LSVLEQRINALARKRETTPARLRRTLGSTVLCETLRAAVGGGTIPLFFVRGGVAMELRLGLAARATKDVDVGLCSEPGQLLPAFDRALSVGFDDFTLERRGEAKSLPSGTLRLRVQVSYFRKPFAQIDVDLTAASSDANTDEVAPLSLAELGLGPVGPVPCLTVAEQVAQKVHALTQPTPNGRPNARARDVIDILLLDERLRLDLAEISRACDRVFAQRATHELPVRFSFPPAWPALLARIARDNGYSGGRPDELERRFNTFLARVNGATTVPGYDYQFALLRIRSDAATNAEGIPAPIETSGAMYAHFVALGKQGWNAVAIMPRVPFPDQLLVLMSRPTEETNAAGASTAGSRPRLQCRIDSDDQRNQMRRLVGKIRNVGAGVANRVYAIATGIQVQPKFGSIAPGDDEVDLDLRYDSDALMRTPAQFPGIAFRFVDDDGQWWEQHGKLRHGGPDARGRHWYTGEGLEAPHRITAPE
jgi:hypothetical protein